ncbi:MAG: DUF4342 domain-containing protein [Candidatus Aminicenantes bacterium]|nr:DUF4342 domain-containing protein [Candidatus Aminicenantes bacterium]
MTEEKKKENEKEKKEGKSWHEEFKVTGGEIIDKVKELIHEGNIRRITIKDEKGKTIIEIPLTLGVVGAALLPHLAAIGAIAALVTKMTIVVEKVEGKK